MAVDYVVQETRFDPGKFHIRVVPKATRRTEDLSAQIAQKSLVQPNDVAAVLATLISEIVGYLIAGDQVILDDFLGFTLTINLKPGVEITDANYSINPDDVEVNISLRNKPALLSLVRSALNTAGDFNKVSVATKAPKLTQVHDFTTNSNGVYTSGGVIQVRGEFLDLPDDVLTDIQNGVFYDIGGGTVYRSDIYISEGDTQITCVVPPQVIGPVTVIVRSDYGGPNLREGSLANIQQAP